MARKSLIVMAGVGAVVALAVAGTALGAATHDVTAAGRQTATVAATSGSDATGSATADETGSTTAGAGGSAGPTGSPDATASTGPVPGGTADAVSAEQAERIAVDRAGGGTVTEIDRDREDGRPVWEVEVTADGVEWEFDIDRETGEVLKTERDDDDDDRDDRDDHDRDDRDDRDDD